MEKLILSQIPIGELADRIAAEVESRINKGPENIEPDQDVIGIDQACQLTGFRKSALYRKTHEKTIPCFKMGKKLLFSKLELLEWMKRNTKRKI